MPEDLRNTIGWLVINALPDDTPVTAAREIIESLTERVGALLLDFGSAAPSTPGVPPPPPDPSDEASQWPTVMIQRRALLAVVDAGGMSPAMTVLVEQALRASEWVEQVIEEHEDGRRDVRRAAPRGPLPDLSAPSHITSR